MQIEKLSDALSVTGQVDPAETEAIAKLGFRSLICNRPDGEQSDQPSWSAVEAAARKAGLETRHIPVGGELTIEDQTEAFAAALAQMPKPILAFCRTGNRSTQLYRAQGEA